MPRTAIKGQAITDFVEEFTYLTKALGVATDTLSTSEERKKDDEPTDLSNIWSLRIDGSSNVNGEWCGRHPREPDRREDQLCPKA